MAFPKLFGNSATSAARPNERAETSSAAVDTRLDGLAKASNRGFLGKLSGIMSAVSQKTRQALNYDVGQGTKDLMSKAREIGSYDVGAATSHAFNQITDRTTDFARTALMVGAAVVPGLAQAQETNDLKTSSSTQARTEVFVPTQTATQAVVTVKNDQAEKTTTGDKTPIITNTSKSATTATISTSSTQAAIKDAKNTTDTKTVAKDAKTNQTTSPESTPKSSTSAAVTSETTKSLTVAEATKSATSAEVTPKSHISLTSVEKFLERPEAKEYGLEPVARGYVDYRRQLAEWRQSDPERAKNYEKSSEIASAYVIEGQFAEVQYPENVVDLWNRKERVSISSLNLQKQLTGESLKAELPAIFTLGIDDAWGKRQYQLGNPEFVELDGSYANIVPIELKMATKSANRWVKKLYSKEALDANLPAKAAAALNALHQLYATSAKSGEDLNPFAVSQERIAVISCITICAGFGEKDSNGNSAPDALLVQKDFATITISYQARKRPDEVAKIPVLHIGRVANMPEALAKVKAVFTPEQYKDLRLMSMPAGFEVNSTEHDESTLRTIRDDWENTFGITDTKKLQELREIARKTLSRSIDIPLVSAAKIAEALKGIGSMTGAPDTPDFKRDTSMVNQLIPLAFNGAFGMPTEVKDLVKLNKKLDAELAVVTKKAEKATLEADIAIAANDAVKKVNLLFEQYEKETDTTKRTEIAKEMSGIMSKEIQRITAIKEELRKKVDQQTLLAYTLLQKKISKEWVAKNGNGS